MSRPLEERFWEKVDKKNGSLHPYKPHLGRCWFWTASTSGNGYGKIVEGTPGRKLLKAHRVSYELHNGPIPVGLKIRHSCDNPPCVNPAHLLCGTHQDNMDDMVKKERQAKHEQNGNSKLTEEQVAEIRRDYVYGCRTHGQPAIGRKYGVHSSIIGLIVRNEIWRRSPNQSSIPKKEHNVRRNRQ